MAIFTFDLIDADDYIQFDPGTDVIQILDPYAYAGQFFVSVQGVDTRLHADFGPLAGKSIYLVLNFLPDGPDIDTDPDPGAPVLPEQLSSTNFNFNGRGTVLIGDNTS